VVPSHRDAVSELEAFIDVTVTIANHDGVRARTSRCARVTAGIVWIPPATAREHPAQFSQLFFTQDCALTNRKWSTTERKDSFYRLAKLTVDQCADRHFPGPDLVYRRPFPDTDANRSTYRAHVLWWTIRSTASLGFPIFSK